MLPSQKGLWARASPLSERRTKRPLLLAGWRTLVCSFLTMPPMEGKRARTFLVCANALCVVCPQLIDCAHHRLDQTLHDQRVASITRAMETLVAGPISKTSAF